MSDEENNLETNDVPENGQGSSEAEVSAVNTEDLVPTENPEEDENAFPDIDEEIGPESASDLEAVYDIPVQVSAVLGKTRMPVSDLLKLGTGAVVELNRKIGESIDIYVNNRLVARGEVVIVDDRLGITMTEIIKNDGK
jgi:flagellar motor switch protein FliN/FliY